MKPVLLVCCFVAFGSPLWAQLIPIDDISGPDRSISDDQFGVSTRYPEGWVIRDAVRWDNYGAAATTISFGALESPDALPRLYYRKFKTPMPNPAGGAEAWLKDEARRKAEQRVAQEGLGDYKNRPSSFLFRKIGGHTALTWTAEFTRADNKWSEYLTAVLSENGIALFFLQAPTDQIQLVIPKYEQMIEALRMP